MPNVGQQDIPAVNSENKDAGVRFQNTEVSKPLLSVRKMCQAGDRVVFSERGFCNSYQDWTKFDVENGVYVLDLWVPPYGGKAEATYRRPVNWPL
jgi:hypothetical protein